MASKIAEILGLSDNENASLLESGEKFTTVSEWVGEIAEGLEKNPALNLLGAVGEAAISCSKPLAVLTKAAKALLREQSPKTLGWIACTLAYREAAEEVIRIHEARPESRLPFSALVLRQELKKLRLDDPSVMEGFSLEHASEHPFVSQSQQALQLILEGSGYNQDQSRRILRQVRAEFCGRLATELTGANRERFAPFSLFLQLPSEDSRLYAALAIHADAQRRELREEAVLGTEPFAIESVYVPPECGVFTWADARRPSSASGQGGRMIDIFAESSSTRQDMMNAVLDLVHDPTFEDCILIMGPPGAGKSTFSKMLTVRLFGQGFLPIRVPLEYLHGDRNLFDAIQDYLLRFAESFKVDTLRSKVYGERVPIEGSEISPYIFIFDGWDEINLAADEGFQQRVDRLLDLIRQSLIEQNRCLIRVIITGRPTTAIERSRFPRNDTRLIAFKATSPSGLSGYLDKLNRALQQAGTAADKIVPWRLGDMRRYEGMLDSYRKGFPRSHALEVLGQPLLAHLAIKVLASFPGDPKDLITRPTTLYRHLTDLTTLAGGSFRTESTGHNVRLHGKQLREALHGTALAITAYGQESIPEDELKARLETLKIGSLTDLTDQKEGLTGLMTAFFFKEGTERTTWEFLHKSFREYLAAEAIIQVLKAFGFSTLGELREKPVNEYWRDFSKEDPRFALTRKLGEIFCGQWLSDEILAHIRGLLEWELQRSFGAQSDLTRRGENSQEVLPSAQWEQVRDALADLWDWWGEGVHLRLQPQLEEGIWKSVEPALVDRLQKRSMRRINYNQPRPPRPLRTATVDALLGYALFELCTLLHGLIAENRGWFKLVEQLGPTKLWSSGSQRPRRYQIWVRHGDREFIQFAPTGDSKYYFRNYAFRIVGAGISTGNSIDFPGKSYMAGVSLPGADLRGMDFDECDMTACNLAGASMYQTSARGACLRLALVSHAELDLADLDGCALSKADVAESIFWGATLRGVPLDEVANLSQKQLNQMSAGAGSLLPKNLIVPAHWQEREPPSQG